MAKIYNQAPLPFMGQKRRWNNDFKTALKNEFADCTIFLTCLEVVGYYRTSRKRYGQTLRSCTMTLTVMYIE